MSTPEGKVKEKIREVLKLHNVYAHMPVLNGMGKPSLDFVCCHRGQFFAIEAKAPGKTWTERQLKTKAEMEAAGGTVFLVSKKSELEEVAIWLASI